MMLWLVPAVINVCSARPSVIEVIVLTETCTLFCLLIIGLDLDLNNASNTIPILPPAGRDVLMFFNSNETLLPQVVDVVCETKVEIDVVYY